MGDVYLGLDVGSTTVKLVVLDENGALLSHQYRRSHGNPRQTVLDASRVLPRDFPDATVRGVGLTGSGGERIKRLIGGFHANELVTQARAVGEYHPEARTVIEIGGQDSKFLSLQWDENSRQMVLVDFAMNALCAAGTGSFLDQQAERLGIEIDGEFARIALAAETPARIAGRCTVFAKSDMIHLQQEGTPLSEILAGLCLALARNFKTIIGKGKSFVPPILFQGGVAFNDAVTRAFESVLRLEPGGLIIPEHRDQMAAIGAALTVRDETREGRVQAFHGFEPLEEFLRSGKTEERSLAPLSLPVYNAGGQGWRSILNGQQPAIPTYMGVDVGSLSTNIVLIDDDDRVLARRYLPTAGRPLEAVQRGLAEVDEEVGEHVRVLAVGATGSGRYLTGHYVGADVIRNEITSQARAAAATDPEVDTIFEIGGQDSKYIRMHHGAVVDFAMNNACAAGTGSFLEEQADRLQISIRDDFEQLAGHAPAPACLGERCTVFMESDLVHHQQRGASVENLTAGLAYSIVNNYLNRVVNTRPIGNRIFFQGGVASNASVAAAFESVTGRSITVPAHNDVTGAIGAAILAREEMESRGPGAGTTFRGFDLANYAYDSEVFVCKACPNLCEVKKVVIGDDPPIFYGARCDKFEEAGRAKVGLHHAIPDLFGERSDMLFAGYDDSRPRTLGRPRVGLPRALIFHDLFPYWWRFFQDLDMDLILSEVTNPDIIRYTQQSAAAETCFPVKLMFGHVMDLLGRDLDFVFLPSIIDRENTAPGQIRNHYCPYIPAAPEMVMAHLDIEKHGPRPIKFPLHMMQTHSRKRELRPLAEQLGIPIRRVMKAAHEGARAQEDFYARVRSRGAEVLSSLGSGPPAVVIVGRPYNSCDPGVCQDLPLKLRKLGVLPIPMDFLPLASVDVTEVHNDMFWRSGQDILAAAKIIAADERLQAIYLTSFNCGPDSFIISFFRRMMGSKPFLELEVDDHTAEAGIVTRCEAFLDSLNISAGVGS
ncbi:MAG: acyl-CoA dehydratase activase [Gemmatimonadota bacterium]